MRIYSRRSLKYIFGIICLLLLVTICLVTYSLHDEVLYDIVLDDGYVVDGLLYKISKEIILRVRHLNERGNVNDKAYQTKFRKAYPVDLIYTLNGVYIFKMTYKRKNVVLKYATYDKYNRNEVKISRTVKHKNIVDIYFSFNLEDRKGYFILMEAMDFALSTDLAKLYPDEIVSIIESVVSALVYLHSLNIIHCDIKLENILVKKVGDRFIYKICDLGGSHYIFNEKLYPPFFTYTETYVAPETLIEGYFTRNTDIWQLGHVVWFYTNQRVLFLDDANRYDKEAYLKYLTGVNFDFYDGQRIEIVERCCAREPSMRITFDEILEWCKKHNYNVSLIRP